MPRALMLQGTGSDVGKTVLVAGLCRLFANRGLAVRPFKPQNMSNNAAVAVIPETGEAGEIGRAQWLQAIACRAAPTVHMNPVLIKPHSDTGAQVVVQGKVAGAVGARDYQSFKGGLLAAVMDSWRKVGETADIVLVEGAGSPAEINLRDRDIANMGFATQADVPVVLVGDIDRGGVIAALAGTHLILPEGDRRMIVGTIVNKFRGDLSLFDEGLEAIRGFTGWPSFGVVPWLKEAARLPAEDGVVLDRPENSRPGARIVVPMLSRIANFDDLDPLRAEPGVEVTFVPPGQRLPKAAAIVIPGSKATIADLAFLRAQGWDRDIIDHHDAGGLIVGLCGGYQMLGRTISDPGSAEGAATRAKGLGLLDVDTVMSNDKIVREASGTTIRDGLPVHGYEIHLGNTTGPGCARPLLDLGGRPDGAVSADGRVFGTYLHGLFASGAFRQAFLAGLGTSASDVDHHTRVDEVLDAIAQRLDACLDCDALLAAAR